MSLHLKNLSFVLVLALLPQTSLAQYYTFQEQVQQPSWLDPMEASYQLFQNTVNLLKWRLNNQPRPLPAEKYNRLQQFGTWILDLRVSPCFNTRMRVLARDSQQEVAVAAENPCRVDRGVWLDPYTGQRFNSASEIQVDHVVALKDAYDSGAHKWSKPYRCLFGNFMAYKNHLLAVSGDENNKKSEKAPDRWMPPDTRYSCQHLQNWLAIKYIWQLNMTDSESRAIDYYIKQYRCDSRIFQASQLAIVKMREAIRRDVVICQNQQSNI